jgi:hypothetical protein
VATIRQQIALEKQSGRTDIPLASVPSAPISRAPTAVKAAGGLLQINRPCGRRTETLTEAAPDPEAAVADGTRRRG